VSYEASVVRALRVGMFFSIRKWRTDEGNRREDQERNLLLRRRGRIEILGGKGKGYLPRKGGGRRVATERDLIPGAPDKKTGEEEGAKDPRTEGNHGKRGEGGQSRRKRENAPQTSPNDSETTEPERKNSFLMCSEWKKKGNICRSARTTGKERRVA